MTSIGYLLRVGGRVLIPLLLATFAPLALASTQTTQPPLKHVKIDLNDLAGLRAGALYFTHQCEVCHSIQGTRLSELAGPLGLTQTDVEQYLDPGHRGYLRTVVSSMPEDIAHDFFNKAQPPDLTEIVSLQSPDWIYTYLNSFYLDPSRPTGANNVVFYNVSMPNVFASLQGLQQPVMTMGYKLGQRAEVPIGVKPVTQGTMTPAQFHAMTRDIVNFLYYVAHPHQQERQEIGKWVLVGLAVLIVLTYLLYKLYWKNVVHPEGGRWWQYWRK